MTCFLKSLPVRQPQQLVAFGAENGGGVVDGIGPGPLDLFPYEFYNSSSSSMILFKECARRQFSHHGQRETRG